MKVVRGLDCFAKRICQKPPLASNVLKTLAPDRCARVSSTLGRWSTSQWILSFSGLRSIQIQIAPLYLKTATMPAHHSVGSSTLEITPIDSIQSSSCLTFGHNNSAMFLGAKRAHGFASGLILIVYSSPKFPSPWNTDAYFSCILYAASEVASTLAVILAGNHRRLVLRLFTTYTVWTAALLLYEN